MYLAVCVRVVSQPMLCAEYRRASSVSEMAAAVSQAAAAGVIASTVGQADNDAAEQAIPTDSTAQQLSDSAGGSTAGIRQGRILGSQGSSKQQSEELDPDQMAMRLALDVLWTGASSGSAQPSVQEHNGDVATK